MMTIPLTYIESIEAEIEKCREWLVHEFGDHMSIHNSLADLREGVLKASSMIKATPKDSLWKHPTALDAMIQTGVLDPSNIKIEESDENKEPKS